MSVASKDARKLTIGMRRVTLPDQHLLSDKDFIQGGPPQSVRAYPGCSLTRHRRLVGSAIFGRHPTTILCFVGLIVILVGAVTS